MKKIGIIGGMSVESTLKYIEWLNRGVNQNLRGNHSPDMSVEFVDLEPVAQMQNEGRWNELGEIMADRAQMIEMNGADFVLLATNTVHRVAPQIEEAISIPFLHIADATADDILEKDIQTVGLLGTIHTMELDFYKGRLERKGVECLVPETGEERQNVNSIIFNELVKGTVNPESGRAFKRAAQGMFDRGAQGLILGCTEVNMLLSQDDFEQPVFDTTRIHVDRALKMALG